MPGQGGGSFSMCSSTCAACAACTVISHAAPLLLPQCLAPMLPWAGVCSGSWCSGDQARPGSFTMRINGLGWELFHKCVHS